MYYKDIYNHILLTFSEYYNIPLNNLNEYLRKSKLVIEYYKTSNNTVRVNKKTISIQDFKLNLNSYLRKNKIEKITKNINIMPKYNYKTIEVNSAASISNSIDTLNGYYNNGWEFVDSCSLCVSTGSTIGKTGSILYTIKKEIDE